MTALLKRDLLILFREPRGWLLSLVFFLLFPVVIAIGLEGDSEKLKLIAAPSIWLAVIFSLLLTFETLFAASVQNGTFAQLRLSGLTSLTIVLSKFVTVFLVSVLPLICITPVIGLLYQLQLIDNAPIMLSLLIGAPAMISLGLLSASLLSSQKSTGFLIILLTLPFLVPVLIFALEGVKAYPANGFWNTGFLALFGLSLLTFAICIPASAKALNINLE